MAKDSPLRIELVDDELRISVGIETLKYAIEHSTDYRLNWLNKNGDTFVGYKILDSTMFAKEVINTLEREDEGGTALIHTFLDDAAALTIEGGCEGLSEDPEELY